MASAEDGVDLRTVTDRFCRTGKKMPWRMGFAKCVGLRWHREIAVVTWISRPGSTGCRAILCSPATFGAEPGGDFQLPHTDGFEMVEVLVVRKGGSNWTKLLAFYHCLS